MHVCMPTADQGVHIGKTGKLIHIHMYMYIYSYVSVYIFICICIYIYTHTYVDIYTRVHNDRGYKECQRACL